MTSWLPKGQVCACGNFAFRISLQYVKGEAAGGDPVQEPSAKRVQKARSGGKLRIGNNWNVITIIALSQNNPLKAIAEFVDGETATPEIIATRQQGRHRYGFGLNFEQAVTAQVGVFGRLGWSDGHNEAFCYTEDDRTVQIGSVAMGRAWRRDSDRAGAAFVANGIVAAHQQYLALGGLGFLLGDGALTYGREKIVEAFYTAHLWRGFFISYDFQHINNSGYNQARGPVAVSAFRFHTDF